MWQVSLIILVTVMWQVFSRDCNVARFTDNSRHCNVISGDFHQKPDDLDLNVVSFTDISGH